MLQRVCHAPFLAQPSVVRRCNDQGILPVMMIRHAILVIGSAPG